MKIVVDENVPFAAELFGSLVGSLGEVRLTAGRAMQAKDVADADVLIVRSVTPVNEKLLGDSQVRFVGTCTIGTDHLDIPWLQKKQIAYASAPGCNAWGVVQYVISVLAHLDLLEQPFRAGIVGCGNVGGRLYRVLKQLGVDCVCVDPFLTNEQNPDLAPFDQIYGCDVVCVHTPLTVAGPYPTRHLFNKPVLEKLKTGCLLLNAGRGGAIDNADLLRHLDRRDHLKVVLDVWENEPDINRELLDAVTLGTPHIAGYSFEGRVNGSMMIHQALVEFLRREGGDVPDVNQEVKARVYGKPLPLQAASLTEAVLATYDIVRDHSALLEAKSELPTSFDYLRKHYWKRREFSHYQIASSGTLAEHLAALGFAVSAV